MILSVKTILYQKLLPAALVYFNFIILVYFYFYAIALSFFNDKRFRVLFSAAMTYLTCPP